MWQNQVKLKCRKLSHPLGSSNIFLLRMKKYNMENFKGSSVKPATKTISVGLFAEKIIRLFKIPAGKHNKCPITKVEITRPAGSLNLSER